MPTACQKVICRQPKIDGNSQFHSCSTASPRAPTITTMMKIPSTTFNALVIHLLAMFRFLTLS